MSKLALAALGGRYYINFDPPFYMGASGGWYYTHNNRRFGPFKTKTEAANSYQNLLNHEGEKR